MSLGSSAPDATALPLESNRRIGRRFGSGSRAALLFVAALLASLAFQLSFPSRDNYLDERDYLALGSKILHGEPYFSGRARAWHTPGYPAFVAVAYALLGETPQSVHRLQAIIGAATCVLTYLLGRRYWGERAAFVAGLLVASYPALVLYQQVSVSETLFTAMLLITLYGLARAVESGRLALFALAAVPAAVGLYVRPMFLAFPWFAFGLLLLPPLRTRRVVAGLVVFAALLQASTLPWRLRNQAVLGAPIFSSKGGLNLWVGNNPWANGAQSSLETLSFPVDPERFQELWPEPEIPRDRAFERLAVEHALHHPIATLRLIPVKLSYLWNGEARDFAFLYGQGKWRSHPLFLGAGLVATTLPFLLLCLAALRALVAHARQLDPAQWVMLSYLGFASANAVLFFGEHRHHLPGVPMLALCAGTLIVAHGRPALTPVQRRVFLVLATLLVVNLAYRAGVDLVTFHSMLETAGRWTP